MYFYLLIFLPTRLSKYNALPQTMNNISQKIHGIWRLCIRLWTCQQGFIDHQKTVYFNTLRKQAIKWCEMLPAGALELRPCTRHPGASREPTRVSVTSLGSRCSSCDPKAFIWNLRYELFIADLMNLLAWPSASEISNLKLPSLSIVIAALPSLLYLYYINQ